MPTEKVLIMPTYNIHNAYQKSYPTSLLILSLMPTYNIFSTNQVNS